MKNSCYWIFTALFPVILPGPVYGFLPPPKPLKIVVENPGARPRQDVLITLSAAALIKKHPGLVLSKLEVFSGQPLPFQLNDLDGNGTTDELAFIVNLDAGEKKIVFLRPRKGAVAPAFPKRTQAEISHKVGGKWENRKYIGGAFQNVQSLRVPPEHTDHSFYIRYEGPGWESDKVGYRFYLDWRNATDIFAKTGPDMVLQNVGQDGFDSYHELGPWGMDVLKVGESLGIGAIGIWKDGKANRVAVTDSLFSQVLLNGPIESMIRTTYYGWNTRSGKVDLISEFSIAAGSHLTRHVARLSQPLDNLCTGIVKHPEGKFFSSGNQGVWSYIANFGKQSLNNDMLGMAVFYRTKDLINATEDAFSHVLVLRPENRQLEYGFLAVWEKEPNGIKTEAAFKAFLQEQLDALNTPVSVKF